VSTTFGPSQHREIQAPRATCSPGPSLQLALAEHLYDHLPLARRPGTGLTSRMIRQIAGLKTGSANAFANETPRNGGDPASR
jgi:hypothetical protein